MTTDPFPLPSLPTAPEADDLPPQVLDIGQLHVDAETMRQWSMPDGGWPGFAQQAHRVNLLIDTAATETLHRVATLIGDVQAEMCARSLALAQAGPEDVTARVAADTADSADSNAGHTWVVDSTLANPSASDTVCALCALDGQTWLDDDRPACAAADAAEQEIVLEPDASADDEAEASEEPADEPEPEAEVSTDEPEPEASTEVDASPDEVADTEVEESVDPAFAGKHGPLVDAAAAWLATVEVYDQVSEEETDAEFEDRAAAEEAARHAEQAARRTLVELVTPVMAGSCWVMPTRNDLLPVARTIVHMAGRA